MVCLARGGLSKNEVHSTQCSAGISGIDSTSRRVGVGCRLVKQLVSLKWSM